MKELKSSKNWISNFKTSSASCMEDGNKHVERIRWNRMLKYNILVNHFIHVQYEHIMDTSQLSLASNIDSLFILMNFYVGDSCWKMQTNYKFETLSQLKLSLFQKMKISFWCVSLNIKEILLECLPAESFPSSRIWFLWSCTKQWLSVQTFLVFRRDSFQISDLTPDFLKKVLWFL